MPLDSLFKSQAVSLLDSIGFTARVLPEGATQSADLEATDPSGQIYTIELKARTGTWREGASHLLAQDGSAVLHRFDPTAASNSLARIFEKAATQLAASAPSDSALRLLWFAAEPSDLHYHYTRIVNTA